MDAILAARGSAKKSAPQSNRNSNTLSYVAPGSSTKKSIVSPSRSNASPRSPRARRQRSLFAMENSNGLETEPNSCSSVSSNGSISSQSSADVQKLLVEIAEARARTEQALQERDAALHKAAVAADIAATKEADAAVRIQFQDRQIAALQTEAERMHKEFSAAQGTLTQYEKKAQLMAEHQTELARESAKHHQTIASLELQLAAAQNRCCALQQQLDQALRALEQLTSVHDGTVEQLAEANRVREELAVRLAADEEQQKQQAAQWTAEMTSVRREYFFAAAVGLKLGLFLNGRPINFCVQPHWELLQQENPPFSAWPMWIQEKIAAAAQAGSD